MIISWIRLRVRLKEKQNISEGMRGEGLVGRSLGDR